ncbi:MAG: hypothetical protein GOVbin140_84 [Prokaryotic dsDNA virus sp.]|jgi:hypothetical protein|nr:MAG: hypothetical protein GOVbin140_84 [Prokaryotic dsDNA virus sp.]|tara:strand:- start:42207 stop:42437 length:231 start_codon:yes stop_codon:yes gene_type:complete
MTEESEMLMLLKELVDKVKKLESAVYNDDNILMKSGFVVVDTPKPSIESTSVGSDNISKMDWNEINDMVSKMEGGF